MRPKAAKLTWFLALSFAVACLATACGRSEPSAASVAPVLLPAAPEEFGAEDTAQTPPDSAVGQTSGPAGAAPESIKFARISREEGLSHSTVTDITQDQVGLMWFATEDGLNKYDGYSFTVFRPEPGGNSIGHIFVWALYVDRDGVLWIGTVGGGLDKFDRRTGRFTYYRADFGDRYGLTSNGVSAIIEDRAGALWLGTIGGGLTQFDRRSERFIRYLPEEGNPRSLSHTVVWALLEDHNGELWVGTTEGLNRLNRDQDEFTRYYHRSYDPDSLSNDTVQSIFEDREGELWIGTLDGLNRFDRETQGFIRYHHDPDDAGSLSHDAVEAIYQDRSGVLWIGTADGLNRFDPETERFIHYRHKADDATSLSNNWVRSIFEDREGVLWVGTYGGGLNKVDRSVARFAHYKSDPDEANSLSGNVVWSIHEDHDGLLWIGTNGQGLNKLDRATGAYTYYLHDPNDPNSLSNNVVRSVCQDREGALWVGTDGGGLDRFEPETGRFIHYQHDPNDARSLSTDRVRVVYEDRRGVLWVGTREGGLNEYEPAKERFIHYSTDPDSARQLRSDTVWSLYQDRRGIFWVGTVGGGLHMADRARDRYLLFQHDPTDLSSLSENSVLSIFEDHSGVLWVGTYGGGLNKLHRETGTFTHYREGDGLPNDIVYGILEDDVPPEQGGPYLWLSTNNGLSRFDPRTETFRNFDTSDGLQSMGFYAGAYHKSNSGEMFFGGVNGFNAFFPERVEKVDNPYVPPVVLTSLTQGGEEVDMDGTVDSVEDVALNWPNNHFEFEFAALSFTNPEENRYAYMLEGFDKDWNYSGDRRFGRYTNLPGGTYTLRIKGSNNDGVWNDEGSSINITVLPPFWDTLWFRGSVAVVVIGLVVGVYRQRVKNIEARSRELETLVQQRTAELRQEIDQRTQVEAALRLSEMEKAVVAERNRLARELHDAVSQTLFSATLIAEALPDIRANDPQEVDEYLSDLQQLNRGALAEMRTLLLELRPAALVDTELGDLLHQLADAVTGREGVPVGVTVDGECDVPADVHVALYRIAQEALNNVVKHARAGQVTVSLRCAPPALQVSAASAGPAEERRVELRVADDGRGFDPDNVTPDHLGLGIMRERAESIGATFQVDGKMGEGTCVTVVWREDNGRSTED